MKPAPPVIKTFGAELFVLPAKRVLIAFTLNHRDCMIAIPLMHAVFDPFTERLLT
jgi:hypothetical protein